MSVVTRHRPTVADGTEERKGNVRLRLSVGAGVGLVLVAAVVAILVTVTAGAGSSEWVGPGRGTESTLEEPTPEASVEIDGTAENGVGEPAVDTPAGAVFVHVFGAVAHPGLYQLVGGARVIDVIAAAGGLSGGVNLARFVGDGEQLYVPVLGEEVVQAERPGSAAAGGPVGLININRANQAELEVLPRVGPALAKRIIDWRESYGGFTSIEDLMSVAGIGQKTFDGLKDFVTT